MTTMTYEFARAADLAPVQHLLSEAQLPFEDIAPHLHHFLLIKTGETLIGCVGLEPAGEFGLLRSLAVAPSHQRNGLAAALCQELTEYALRLGVKELWLLTTTAEAFFRKQGFTKVARSEAPAPIQSTHEFKVCCPCTAVCMRKQIGRMKDEG